MYFDNHGLLGEMNQSPSPEREDSRIVFGVQDFFVAFKEELKKGVEKYGFEDDTIPFIKSIDKNFELGAVAKYISRISRGDARAKEDCIKAATYLYFYWVRLVNGETGL